MSRVNEKTLIPCSHVTSEGELHFCNFENRTSKIKQKTQAQAVHVNVPLLLPANEVAGR